MWTSNDYFQFFQKPQSNEKYTLKFRSVFITNKELQLSHTVKDKQSKISCAPYAI